MTSMLSPKFLGGESGPLGQGLELKPDDFGVDLDSPGEGAETAIDPGYHVFPPDTVGVPGDALGRQLRVFDEVGRGVDHSGDDDLPLGIDTGG
jgi:hypothetical protein